MTTVTTPTAIRFTVPGSPRPQPQQKGRVVMPKGGKPFVHSYTPTDSPSNAFKTAAKFAAREAHKGAPLEGPIFLHVTFVLPRPKYLVWKKRDMPRCWHTARPDLKNLLWALEDALSGITFRDDSQIARASLDKRVAGGDEQPHTEVLISALADDGDARTDSETPEGG